MGLMNSTVVSRNELMDKVFSYQLIFHKIRSKVSYTTWIFNIIKPLLVILHCIKCMRCRAKISEFICPSCLNNRAPWACIGVTLFNLWSNCWQFRFSLVLMPFLNASMPFRPKHVKQTSKYLHAKLTLNKTVCNKCEELLDECTVHSLWQWI